MSPNNRGELVDQNTSEVLLSLTALRTEAQARRSEYVQSLIAMEILAQSLNKAELEITGKIRVFDDPGPLNPGGGYHDSFPYRNVERLRVAVALIHVVDREKMLPNQPEMPSQDLDFPYIHIVGVPVDTTEYGNFVQIDLDLREDSAHAEVVGSLPAQA